MNEAYLFKTLNPVLSIVKLHIFSNKKYYLLSSQFHKPHFPPTKPNSATKPKKKKINLSKIFNNTIKKKKKKSIPSLIERRERKKNVISASSLLLLIITYSPLTSHSSLKLNFFPSSRIPASQNAVVSKAALFPPLTFLYILFIYKLHTQLLFEIFSILEM